MSADATTVAVRPKTKYFISNIAYGQTYANLFLSHHIKSLLDPSNLPAITEKYDVTYLLYTDEESMVQISRHPNFMRLGRACPVEVGTIAFPTEANRYEERYGVQIQLFSDICRRVAAANGLLSFWPADMVLAKDCLPRLLARIEAGHDAILGVPMRATAECASATFEHVDGALTDQQLFDVAYQTQHPLWVASHVENAQFSKMPFTMLWNSGRGLLAHSFSVSPLLFRPTEAIAQTKRVIDSEVPALFKNPFWARDWTDAPMIGAEPINCYYPMWGNRPIDLKGVGAWARCLAPSQPPQLRETFYYPNREKCGFGDSGTLECVADLSSVTVEQILSAYRNAQPERPAEASA